MLNPDRDLSRYRAVRYHYCPLTTAVLGDLRSFERGGQTRLNHDAALRVLFNRLTGDWEVQQDGMRAILGS